MNKAVEAVTEVMDVCVKEFTVAGIPDGSLFSHHWYVGCDEAVDPDTLMFAIDEKLKELNDDYAVERKHALKNVIMHVLPTDIFYDWLKSEGKEGGQSKFPRVLKKEKLESWHKFVDKEAAIN
jgi:hypothetical protein